ncbi:MAG: ATP synthase subunit I [Dethiobacteria bacterium]|jgi:hypothetical protein
MITNRSRSITPTEKTMVILGAVAITIGWALGYPSYALGVALAAPIGWLLHCWQSRIVINLKGLPPHKLSTRLQIQLFIRLIIHLSVLGLSILGGEPFLFGVLTGFLLEVIIHMGQAFYIILKKKGGLS